MANLTIHSTSRYDQLLVEGDADSKVADLESKYHLILKPVGDSVNATRFTIQLPMYFVALYNEVLDILTTRLMSSYFYNTSYNEGDWEHFIAHHIAFTNNLQLGSGNTEVTLGKIFTGAYCASPEILNLRIKLRVLDVCASSTQFPTPDPIDRHTR